MRSRRVAWAHCAGAQGCFGMTCLRSGISSVRADFSPPGEADLPHHFSHGSSNRTRESSESGKDSYLPDGECSVKCQWGTRIRLKAFAVLTKSCHRRHRWRPTALQGTPWRGDTPRRGLSAQLPADWDGPHQHSLNHPALIERVASLLGSGCHSLRELWSGTLVVPECCWTDTVEIDSECHCVLHPCQCTCRVSHQGEMRCRFLSMGAESAPYLRPCPTPTLSA